MARSPFVSTTLFLLLVPLITASGCAGREFMVGGDGGWVELPAETFNHWAERQRFHVNDTLEFKYYKDADSVLQVTQNGYNACNTSQPLLRLTDGDSRFVLSDPGYYYFISANEERCHYGEERLIVLAMHKEEEDMNAPSPVTPTPPPPKSPSPSAVNDSASAPPPPPPKSASSSSTAPPHAQPKPGSSSSSSPPPLPPKSSSSSAPPPAQPKPGTSSASAPPPPSPLSAGNASSPSPAPLTAPVEPTAPSTSSAVALRAGGILACFFAAALL